MPIILGGRHAYKNIRERVDNLQFSIALFFWLKKKKVDKVINMQLKLALSPNKNPPIHKKKLRGTIVRISTSLTMD